MFNEIDGIYEVARTATVETGVKHEVDHTLPIVSDLVCGLHVPWNLEVLTKSENSAKNNRLPDDPADWCAWPHALDLPHHQVAASPVS